MAIVLSRLHDGLFLDVNDTWVALNGRSRDEAVGHSARTMGTWPDAEAAARFVHELRAAGLGLRLVQILAGQLNGTVEARAVEGGGAELEVAFPRALA